MLDAVQHGPVYLDSLDVHAAWVNTAASSGNGNGDPTGLLLERAVDLVTGVLPVPPPATLAAALREGQAEAHRLGVTGIHDVEDLRTWAAFRRLETEGDLALRVLFHPPVKDLPALVRDRVRSGGGSPWLATGGVKMFLDGSLGSRTAWMLEPYAGTRDRGMPITGEREAREAMRLAAERGIAVTVHAIGDAAVCRALDLMARLPRAAVTHGTEHLQCVHPADLGRAAAAGIVASMQPAHLLTDAPLIERHRAGREGARTPSTRCVGAAPSWSSAAMYRWPPSIPWSACMPRWRDAHGGLKNGWARKRSCARIPPRRRGPRESPTGAARSRPAATPTWWPGRRPPRPNVETVKRGAAGTRR